MNFLVDENVDRQIADSLRLMGYNVEYVAEKDAGISDDEVLEMANEKIALLLTADKDFGESRNDYDSLLVTIPACE